MILISDTGATSSNWRSIKKNGEIGQFKSLGFNPYNQPIIELEKELRKLDQVVNDEVSSVFYYGAGCGSEENRSAIKAALKIYFPNADIAVEDDLLAAARAVCGHDEGIACILGTGANSCYYDGKRPVEQVASLGFILGDEGSGAYLGKVLLADYLRKDMPSVISDRLHKRFNLDRTVVLQHVYHKSSPARYVASFTKFLLQNINDPYCYRLVYDAFSLFFEKNVLKYAQVPSVPVHFSGSIGFYFGNILRQVANDKGVVVRNIIESPIAGLTLYHKNQSADK